MAAVKDLFIDIGGAGSSVNGQPRLVRGILDSSTYTFPLPYHGDKLNIAIRALTRNPDATASAPYSYINVSSCTITFKIWNADGDTVLASQSSWTLEGTTILKAQLDLYTTEMIAAMVDVGVKETLSTIIEIVLTFSDGIYTYRNNDFRIGRSLNTSGSGVATTTERVMTWAEANALFVKWIDNEPGKAITLENSDSTYERIIGVRTDGSAQDDVTAI
jgi:hypothetical protein